jgi:hypothetical protein
MKRFQFPLQKVLEYDTRVEKNKSDILLPCRPSITA